MISPDFSNVALKLRRDDNCTSVFDPVRKKWVVLTPEEHVRQYMIAYLKDVMHYPVSLIAVEKKIMLGNLTKRYDIVVYNRNHEPWMLVECKAPDVDITESTLNQLLHYHNVMQCAYWMLTNGRQTFCADARDHSNIQWLLAIPAYDL
jgi:hypothetical protein